MSDEIVWEDPRRVLARHGLAPKRGFSQNFLVSRSVVERIASALALEPGQTVVELGPGLGTLTGGLLRAGAHVIAIDADRDMLRVLAAELGQYARLDARHGDATSVDLAKLGAGERLKVAGNLPYAVTGGIFRRLVQQNAYVERAVLMVQREVRDRLVSPPGSKDYGALSVFTQGVFDVRGLFIVPSGAFFPAPRVDSAVVSLTPRSEPIAVDDEPFSSVVRAAFEARRKTLRNALLRRFPADVVDSALSRAELDGQRRGETLSVEEFQRLAGAIAPLRAG